MSKFKVGERVVFYSSGERKIGVINLIIREYVYEIRYGEHTKIYIPVHEKQIRRLVKKKKQKLGRELWFVKDNHDTRFLMNLKKPNYITWHNVIHVREILNE